MPHAGLKARAWAAKWAVPTEMKLYGLAEAVTGVARKREAEDKNVCVSVSSWSKSDVAGTSRQVE